MIMTPGTYIRLRREAGGQTIEEIVSLLGTEPHLVPERDRAEWLRAIEADTTPIGENMVVLRYAIAFDCWSLTQLIKLQYNPGSVEPPRLCRTCACSEHDPCADEAFGTCAWVAADLCSTCALDDPDGSVWLGYDPAVVDDDDSTAATSPDADGDGEPTGLAA